MAWAGNALCRISTAIRRSSTLHSITQGAPSSEELVVPRSYLYQLGRPGGPGQPFSQRTTSPTAAFSSQAQASSTSGDTLAGSSAGEGRATAAFDAATLGPDTPPGGGVEAEGSATSSGRQPFWWQAAKATISTVVVAGLATGGWVTYKYDTDTIEQKLKETRSSLLPAAAKEDLRNEARVLGPFEGIYTLMLNGAFQAAEAYLDARHKVEEQMHGWSAPSSDRLLPDLLPPEQHLYTLVLDLNDTLVHLDWKRERGWRTFKRPGVDAFLEKMAQNYEVVVFSDQLNMTVDPILDRLDRKGCVRHRLYRDGTQYLKGQYLRDLTKLNRDHRKILYLTGHPENCMQQENVIALPPWTVSDLQDTALLDFIPFLEHLARHRPADIRAVLASYQGQEIPSAFRERSKEVLRRQQERKSQGLLRLVR